MMDDIQNWLKIVLKTNLYTQHINTYDFTMRRMHITCDWLKYLGMVYMSNTNTDIYTRLFIHYIFIS